MTTRRTIIELILRQILNGQPSDDTDITDNLVNQWLNIALGLAAKKNYTDNLQLEGVAFVNNSFFSTFKGIELTEDERNLYKFTLPSIPLGIGATDGIARIVFKNTKNEVSFPAVLLSENQVAIQRSMRPVPNKILCYSEGGYAYAITSILMGQYTASVTLVSGGNANDLDSYLNIPDDYLAVCVEYIRSQLAFETAQKKDISNDGSTIN